MKYIISFLIVLFFTSSSFSQSLLIHHFDANEVEVKVDTFKIGDYIVISHAKGNRNPHFFEGKITGLYPRKGEVKVFDYARSTRVMPIVGKNIKVENIRGVARPDAEEMKKRETKGVVTSAVKVLGSQIGGDVGDAVYWGGSASRVAFDLTSRKRVDNQRIKCEISQY